MKKAGSRIVALLAVGAAAAAGSGVFAAVPQAAGGPAPTAVAAPDAALLTVTVPVAAGQASGSITMAQRPLPPLFYPGAVAGDELFNLIKANARFAALSKDVVGSPITLRTWTSYRTSAGGTATSLASAILAGGSLGLLPIVTNGDLAITYELLVNGTVLASYTYEKNLTRVQNIYIHDDSSYGMGSDGLAWAKGTVAQFLADAARDPKLDALSQEYQFYFGSGAK